MTESSHEDAAGPLSESWRTPHIMAPHRTFRHRVRADQLVDRITPNGDLFVLAHFGIPRIAPEDWRLQIAGLISRPLSLSFDDLTRFPRVEVESFIKCAGFPHDPTIATRNVSNAVWVGADLARVLDEAGLDPAARYLWTFGPDHGTYARWSADRYVKDLPVERLRAGLDRVLLVYEVNGEPLSAEHGFPVRLFVPGFYGTNSVKWLCRIEAADARADSLFTTELYNDPVPAADPARSAPVWGAAPEALIVAPADRANLPAGPIEVWGWCWGEHEIAAVDVSADHGQSWQRAITEPRHQSGWQKFCAMVTCGLPGQCCVMARATSVTGETQPGRDARNAIHSIEFKVV
jgi:DMSO/TMAO reductase YedYZ molybdopterin-dependent catalytic subunit